MRIGPVRLSRGLATLVLSGLVSACSGLSVSEGPNPSTSRMAAEKPSGQVGIYLRVAQEALYSRDYTTAIRFYETILERTPDNLAAARGIATAYTLDGKTAQAVKAYEAAIAMAPNDQLVRENLAALLNSRVIPAAGGAKPKKIRVFMDLTYSGTFEDEAPSATAKKFSKALPDPGSRVNTPRAVAHTTVEAAQLALQSVAEAAIIEELGEITPATGNPFLLFYPPTPENLPIRRVTASNTQVAVMSSPPAASPPYSSNAEIGQNLRDLIRNRVNKAPAVRDDGYYRVQLAAYRTSRHADRGVAIFQRILGNAAPQLEILERRRSSADAQTIDFRIRTAALGSRQIADTLCNAMRARGQECLVIRHKAIFWQNIA
jgi:tetratricopeptide (TPR) repeat protein